MSMSSTLRNDDVAWENGTATTVHQVVKEAVDLHEHWAFIDEIILKAWERAGICPLNPQIFTDADFAPRLSASVKSYLHDTDSAHWNPPHKVTGRDIEILSDGSSSQSAKSDEEGSAPVAFSSGSSDGGRGGFGDGQGRGGPTRYWGRLRAAAGSQRRRKQTAILLHKLRSPTENVSYYTR